MFKRGTEIINSWIHFESTILGVYYIGSILFYSLNDVDHIDWFPQELCSKYKQFTDQIQDWLALVKYHPYIQGRDPWSNPKILFLFASDPW